MTVTQKEMIDHNSQHSTHEIKVKNFCILVTKLMLEYCSKLPIIDAFGNLTWIEPAFRDRRHPLSHSCPQKITGNSFEFFKILRVSSSFFLLNHLKICDASLASCYMYGILKIFFFEMINNSSALSFYRCSNYQNS